MQETVTLRCECGLEAVVFTKYTYKDEIDYDISIEDSYVGGYYTGFFGRLKRAWHALICKPVVYTGVYCDDKAKMRKFLTDSLALVDNLNGTDDNSALIEEGKW